MKPPFWMKMIFLFCLIIVSKAAEEFIGFTHYDITLLLLILIYIEVMEINK